MQERETDEGTVLYSYFTPVAIKLKDGGHLKTNESFSRTTSKHITKWLDGAIATPVDHNYFERFAI
jgi:hypothetical protein